MADTTVSSNLTVEQWDDMFFAEYVRDNRFKRYMGTGMNRPIIVKEELTTKPGNAITIPLVTRLTNSAVTGNQRLSGNEESLGNYGHKIDVTHRRNAVLVTAEEEQKSPISLRNAAREMLKLWAMEDTRDLVIRALGSVAIADGSNIAYASADETTQKDVWLANNSDRVLFGAAKSNNSANDHSASLANIDNTTDKLDPDMISLAKRMAKTASPRITPIRTSEDEEWYVMFCPSVSFRDLKTNSTMTQANREAWNRYNGGMNGGTNPLFRDGDLVWDGVIIREVPEIGVLSGVGGSSIDVAPNYLCGVGAVGVAYASRWKSALKKEDDYGFEYGVGIAANYGVEKLFFNTKQYGVVTVYSAGVADS